MTNDSGEKVKYNEPNGWCEEIITTDPGRWKPFLHWLCEQGEKFFPQFHWVPIGPYPNHSGFTSDTLRIVARYGKGLEVTGDILWFAAEWMLEMPIEKRKQAARMLLSKIARPRIFIDDSFCAEAERRIDE